MTRYGADDFTHLPTADPDWQESVVLIVLDDASGLAGFVRIGAEPNLGLSQLHLSLATRDGLRYRHHRFDQPLRPDDRHPEGFAAGPVRWRIAQDEPIHITADLDGLRLDLRMRDDFASTAWQMLGSDDMRLLAPGHLESSGSVSGHVRIGTREFRIEHALAHRDHSWGRRDVRVMRSFRWVAGCCGPALAFSGAVVQLASGAFVRSAWLRRNGRFLEVRDFDVVASVNADGLTTRGGTAVWTLADGERVRIEAEVLDGFITSYRSDHGGTGSHVGVEGLATARCGALQGFCDFNICNNPAGGEQAAVSVCESWATLTPGISQRPCRESETP